MNTIRVHVAEQPEYQHHIHLARMEEGMTVEEVAEHVAYPVTEPSPYEFLGGIETMGEGSTAYFTVDFEPGRYAFICHDDLVKEFAVEPSAGESG